MEILTTLTTEQRNESTMEIDHMSTYDILKIFNQEDQSVAKSVERVLPEIAEAVEIVSAAFTKGGRLLYVGAGTSGRIGILDAVECPPTFGTPPDLVQGMIAGGDQAIMKAVEGAEDNPALGAADLEERGLTELDVVVGIAASGRTPYVAGALKHAQELGAKTISLSSNKNAKISQYADIKIDVVTGPEVLTGSTRLKAATAHKMVLNMLTTTTMIQAGKIYQNLMVDVKVSNYKLKERAKHIIAAVTEVSLEEAAATLEKAQLEVKPAIVMIKANVNYEEAKKLLHQADGFVRYAITRATSDNDT
ncbi:N-acetylmuramic acid 6-phosphate etherase [Gracilibacillus phocaeensis]|uniref:N-acetylmuramic acid 6-phosphate etherase n=1 Tax=Gracilibacillus phocaeensis TaxID=2042304 RepID=UPI0010305F8E|nr:N-acetylmuramic acid 6-phosphate etherase [Gracilibacillus phocaeensis]